MHESVIPSLQCPACLGARFDSTIRRRSGQRILEGLLRCARCGVRFSIHDGILDAYSALAGNPAPASLRTQSSQWLMERRWFARSYERLVRPLLIGAIAGSPHWLRQESEFLLSSHRLASDDLVLDAACGPGRFSRILAQHSPTKQVVAVDISPSMLAQHRRRNQQEGLSDRITLIRADVARLPFVDRAFGAVNCFTAFHLFPDLDRAVGELARVLRSGRRFTTMVVIEPDALWGRPAARFAARLGRMHLQTVEDVRRVLWRHRMATVQEAETGMVVLLGAVLAEHSVRSAGSEG